MQSLAAALFAAFWNWVAAWWRGGLHWFSFGAAWRWVAGWIGVVGRCVTPPRHAAQPALTRQPPPCAKVAMKTQTPWLRQVPDASRFSTPSLCLPVCLSTCLLDVSHTN